MVSFHRNPLTSYLPPSVESSYLLDFHFPVLGRWSDLRPEVRSYDNVTNPTRDSLVIPLGHALFPLYFLPLLRHLMRLAPLCS